MTNHVVIGYLIEIKNGIEILQRKLDNNMETISAYDRIMIRNTLKQMGDFIDISITDLKRNTREV